MENNNKLVIRSKNKENRWDRIRKKHINNINVKTEMVRKFFNMNFINPADEKILNGHMPRVLDPGLVMDMRHEMIQRKSKLQIKSEDPLKIVRREKLEEHKKVIEATLIKHELSKFKTEIQKLKPQKTINIKSSANNFHIAYIDNRPIFENIQKVETSTISFFEASMNAPLQAEQSLQSTIFDNDNTAVVLANGDLRNVHFGDTEVINYSQEPTFTSYSSCEQEVYKHEDVNGIDTFDSYSELSEDDCIDSAPTVQTKTEQNCSDSNNCTQNVESLESFQLIGKSLQETNNIEDTSTNIKVCCNVSSNDSMSDSLNNSDLTNDESQNFIIKKMELENHDLSHIIVTTTMKTKCEIVEEKSVEQVKIINELFSESPVIPNKEYNKKVLRECFQKWLQMSALEKIKKHHKFNREERAKNINEFLNRIRHEKNRTKQMLLQNTTNTDTNNTKKIEERENAIVIAKRYHNKMKMQQDLIELQKMKLQKQERMISELKLSKINEELKEAKDEIKIELRNVARRGNVHLRCKAKCLQIISDLKDEEDNELGKLHAQGLEIPKFLSKMQERASERLQRHEDTKERRLRLEQEKEFAKSAAEEAKRREDEEAKQKRIEELREKRRLEKQLKQQREENKQKYLENMKIANNFNRKRLLLNYGIKPLRKLIFIKRLNEVKAKQFSKRLAVKYCFKKWKIFTNSIWEIKRIKADYFYRKYLIRIMFKTWRKKYLLEQSKVLIAIDWYEMRLCERIVRHWTSHVKEEKYIQGIHLRQAIAHHEWNLKWKVLEHWQRLPMIVKLEKETEERRQRWRIKIWELLPDYMPNEDY